MNPPELLLQVGRGAFYRMAAWSRPKHVIKHLLNHGEAWGQLGLVGRHELEAWIADFEDRGVVCGDEHVAGRMSPGRWNEAQAFHDEVYELLVRLVLEDFAEGSDDVEAAAGRGASGRLDHTLLCLTVIYDTGGQVRSAYRGHLHPVSSGLRPRQKNHVRRALLRASIAQDDQIVDGDCK